MSDIDRFSPDGIHAYTFKDSAVRNGLAAEMDYAGFTPPSGGGGGGGLPVNLENLVNNDFLKYDGTNEVFINITLAALRDLLIPVGTIWQGIASQIPDGYLVCDGTEYLKSAYPRLATHLAALDTSYSTTLYVGTDNDHFKVPDLRGEFLRGTGTNGHTNQGNGSDVGIHQNGTVIPHVQSYSNLISIASISASGTAPANMDKSIKTTNSRIQWANATGQFDTSSDLTNNAYIPRPTNTSVLFGIKY